MPAPNPCSALHRLPRGTSENLSPSQTYRLAHSVECKLNISVERPDRDLRFVLGHAFTLDKIKLRIVEIREEDERNARATRVVKGNVTPGRVSFGNVASGRPRDAASPAARKQASPPPPPRNEEWDSDSTDSDAGEEEEDLALTLTSSHKPGEPASRIDIPDLVPSSDSDSSSESEEEDLLQHRPSDKVLESILKEPGDEGLAELYETVAGCPCHGQAAPAIEKIWEIPQTALDGGKGTEDAQKFQGQDRKWTGKRLGIVKVSG